ncbi:MAG: outer membrane protein assembly factor BamA [Bacteriovoracaceae bacterium]|nr:outer membrane protein assembly factor BamA [Bacteroidota bacterium]
MTIKKIAIALLCVGGMLFAQQGMQQKQYKILGISVSGNTLAEPAAVIGNSGLKVGDEITVPGEQTRNAIMRLWNLKIFANVDIQSDNFVGDGVYLIIQVEEFPRLEKVEYVGNEELDDDDLDKKINVTKGQIISPQEINKISKIIKKAYEEEGYLQTLVTSELIDATDSTAKGRKILKLTVNEGNDARIREIQFFGNSFFEDDDLEGELPDVNTTSWWKFWRSGKLEKKKYEEGKKKLIDFYKKNGFRDAELISDSVVFSDDKEDIILKLVLFEGPQYKIRTITWEGNTVFTTEALIQRLGFQSGEVYDMEKFEQNLRANQDQTDVSSMYLDNGYLTVQIEPEEKKVGKDEIDIVIRVRERNQFKIAGVEIRGNTKTQERVIRRELYVRPGDYFSRSNIIRSIRQLSVLNYFNPEKIKPDTKFVDDKNVDIVLDVEEKSSDTFNASVGYSGAFGATGALGLTFNNFDITEPFSGGGGQVLNFDWQFGEGSRYRTFSISFREPWVYDTPTSFGFSLYDTKQDYYSSIHQQGGTISVGRRFKFPDDYFSATWTFRFQNLEVSNVGASYYYQEGKTSQLSISQVIQRNSVNSPLFPTQGSNISLFTEIAGAPILPGTAQYNKHLFSADWYMPVLNSSRVALYFGSQFGVIFPYKRNSFIPIIETFNMGGTGLGQIATTPLRGYEDRSIGPVNVNGQYIPAHAMAKHTAELRFNVALNPIPIYFLAFAEAGNTWETPAKSEMFDLKRSAGLGARLLINPIGLLGFDYGYGYDNITSGIKSPTGWKFHFQFGRGF